MKIPLDKKEWKQKFTRDENVKWQEAWDNSERGRFLYNIQNKVLPTFKSRLLCRRDENIIHRLRVGSCLLNETLFKMKLHRDGECQFCQVSETVKHYLTECREFHVQRTELLVKLKIDVPNLHVFLSEMAQREIIRYVKDTDKYATL